MATFAEMAKSVLPGTPVLSHPSHRGHQDGREVASLVQQKSPHKSRVGLVAIVCISAVVGAWFLSRDGGAARRKSATHSVQPTGGTDHAAPSQDQEDPLFQPLSD